MNTRVWVAALAATVTVVGGTAWAVSDRGPDRAEKRTAARPTVTVEKGTIRQEQRLTGRVGHSVPRTITGSGEGIVTWLPSPGDTVARGEQLYRVDDQPVALFHGTLPLYRQLAPPQAPPTSSDEKKPSGDAHDKDGDVGSGGDPSPDGPLRGNDVDLVATNLAALGYYGGPTDGAVYSGALVSAVERWQADHDGERTGVLGPDTVVVSRGTLRVAGVTATVGSPAAADVLTVTSTRSVVTLDAPQGVEVAVGRPVEVTLADGTTVRTRVTAVGSPVEDPQSGAPVSAPITVRARGTADLGPAAPVTGVLVIAARRDVLHVPASALLALAGGGYALERPGGALVPVTLGLVADGDVEVTGIEQGAKVVVAR
ncbi:peptidoglycan-binding protein [Aeromicrobium endophyticum]|uniref:peptidoglycan-binding protein n=1 Tax=Aeromicrobium endophyticum TaxID=2292704 RepID=UPI001314D62C|nr:peptidoglycan-binding protein [Aeromicrobium endophyticum]